MATDANPNDTNDSVMAVKEHKFSTVSKFKDMSSALHLMIRVVVLYDWNEGADLV